MKKKLVAGGVLMIAIAILAMGTYAYLVDAASARNIITTGTVEMTLTEYSTYSENESERVLYSNPEGNIMPGESISKIPVIKNVGTAPFWARVKVEINLGDNEPQYQLFSTTETNPLDYISLNIDTEDIVDEDKWICVDDEDIEDDGYLDVVWYYVDPIQPGQEVTFFTEVSFSSEMGNFFQGKEISIDVQGDAVQSDNNPLNLDSEGKGIYGIYLWNAEDIT